MYSAEGAILGWGAVFANEERGIAMRYAGFFYVAFAVMMTATRFLGDSMVARVGQRNIIAGGAALAAIGFAVAALINSPIATVIGFALIGLGAANLAPQLVSYVGNVEGISVQNAVSIVNALGYSGILVGPVAIGFIAQNFSLTTSFCCIAVLCLLVSITSFLMLRQSK